GFVRTDPRWLLGRVRRWAAGRFRTEAGMSLSRLLVDALRGQVRLGGFTLTSHHFMNPAELKTEVGQARLAACVFRLPYHGEMVPMCRMNADGVRERFYTGITAGEADLEGRLLLPVVH
ncbi:MAG: hypothetical protein WAM82_12570, partial [Thermoanaerobaculia bacterium]